VPETVTRTFNLLRDPWIPVRRRSRKVDWIAPHQITEQGDPPVEISSFRPDFDGALWQFLIGLLQTILMPGDEEAWRERYEEPPTPEQLQKAFSPYLEAFWLDGPGPRYMQETGLKQTKKDDIIPIRELLATSLASELFSKPEAVSRMGQRALAMTLTTVQMYAWGAGRGHRTCVRGAGALTSLVHCRGESLFRNLWLNVLSQEDWSLVPGDHKKPLSSVFPWMEPPRKVEKGETRPPQQRNPAEHFWAMPHRYWIQFSGPGHCDLVGAVEPSTSEVLRRPDGLNYEGAWMHPLSPHRRDPKDGTLSPARVSDQRIPYREWPGMILGQREGSAPDAVPAATVQIYRLRGRGRVVRGASGGPVGLRLIGYQMPPGQAKVFGWLEQETPLLSEDEAEARDLAPVAARLVAAAETVRLSLFRCCKEALKRRAEDIDFKASVLQGVSRSFWSGSEPAFLEHIEHLRHALKATTPAEIDAVKLSWLKALRPVAMEIFAGVSQEAAQFGATDIARIARAHNKLLRETSPHLPSLQEAVGLPVAARSSSKKAPKKQGGSS
jgi:CRISPR system Cascade subunit CasA